MRLTLGTMPLKSFMSAIESMNPTQEFYNAQVKVLGEVRAHHLKEAEHELLPAAKKM